MRDVLKCALFSTISTLLLVSCALEEQPPIPQEGEVLIVRDTYGVAHIYATNDVDLMYGHGYATAENRLHQMFASARLVQGRLAELQGEDALETDILLRSFRLKKRAEEALGSLDPATLERTKAYCRGVNDYIAANRDSIPEWIDEYSPSDVVALSMLINIYFPLDEMRGDLRHAQQGSNQFAVAPAHSQNGYAMLSMDPHLMFSGPLVWTESHLTTPEYSVVGAVIPGLPGIIMGHNKNIAWCYTNNNPDLADVYAFKIDPDDRTRYLSHDGWKEFVVHEETFKIKTESGEEKRVRTLMQTHVGPVIQVKDGTAYAAALVQVEPGGMYQQSYNKMRAASVEEYFEIMNTRGMSMWNQMVADTGGNIGYLYNAVSPKRDPSLDWSRPVPGEDPRSQWQGFIPFEQLPRVVNPESGWLQNCNNVPWFVTENSGIDKVNLPFRLVAWEIITDRARRLSELLAGDKEVNFEEMIAYATDTLVLKARWWVPRLTAAYEQLKERMSLAGTETEKAIELLNRWDFRAEADSPAMALFYYWYGRGNLGAIDEDAEFTDDIKQKQMIELGAAAAEMKSRYGRIDIPWGQLLYLKRGEAEFSLSGGSSMFSIVRTAFGRMDESGRIPVSGGSSYQMVVELSPTPRARSSFPFGVDENPESKHFIDMTMLYHRKQYKPVWFTWSELRPNIEESKTLNVGER